MLQANFTLIFLLCTYNILLAQNVRISNLDYPNEPSIAMDPKTPRCWLLVPTSTIITSVGIVAIPGQQRTSLPLTVSGVTR